MTESFNNAVEELPGRENGTCNSSDAWSRLTHMIFEALVAII